MTSDEHRRNSTSTKHHHTWRRWHGILSSQVRQVDPTTYNIPIGTPPPSCTRPTSWKQDFQDLMTAWMCSCWWTRGECSCKSCFHDVGLVHEGGEVLPGMLYLVRSNRLTWPDRIPCHCRHVDIPATFGVGVLACCVFVSGWWVFFYSYVYSNRVSLCKL